MPTITVNTSSTNFGSLPADLSQYSSWLSAYSPPSLTIYQDQVNALSGMLSIADGFNSYVSSYGHTAPYYVSPNEVQLNAGPYTLDYYGTFGGSYSDVNKIFLYDSANGQSASESGNLVYYGYPWLTSVAAGSTLSGATDEAPNPVTPSSDLVATTSLNVSWNGSYWTGTTTGYSESIADTTSNQMVQTIILESPTPISFASSTALSAGSLSLSPPIVNGIGIWVSNYSTGLTTDTALISGFTYASNSVAATQALSAALAGNDVVSISGDGSLDIISSLVAAGSGVTSVTLSDSAENVVANLDQLETLAAQGKIASITLTDPGVPELVITPAQQASDALALQAIVSPHTITVPGEVVLHGPESEYEIANSSGSPYIVDTGSAGDGTQTLPGVTEMVFINGVGIFDPTGAVEDIARLYGAALNRAPDIAGIYYWTNGINSGNASLTDVANNFAASPEFIQDYGTLSNSAFINQLYENVLGRPADPTGAAYWDTQVANGLSRGGVLLGFAESQEYEAATISTAGDQDNGEVYRLYEATLDRAPDPAGQAYWASQLEAGATPTQIAQGFVTSDEFMQDYGTLSIDNFVTTLYSNVLNRPPDPAGFAYWTGQLQGGASEESMVIGFSDSAEFRASTSGATHANWVFIPNAS